LLFVYLLRSGYVDWIWDGDAREFVGVLEIMIRVGWEKECEKYVVSTIDF